MCVHPFPSVLQVFWFLGRDNHKAIFFLAKNLCTEIRCLKMESFGSLSLRYIYIYIHISKIYTHIYKTLQNLLQCNVHSVGGTATR
jgi:hypothetical protein